MGLFSKKKNNEETINNNLQPTVTYPFEVTYWNAQREGIEQLINELELDLNSDDPSAFLKCKLVPEPDNEHDKNAIQVYAGVRGRNTKYYLIGYVPSDIAQDLKPDIKKVVSNSHYWLLRIKFDIIYGLRFDVWLKESKFQQK